MLSLTSSYSQGLWHQSSWTTLMKRKIWAFDRMWTSEGCRIFHDIPNSIHKLNKRNNWTRDLNTYIANVQSSLIIYQWVQLRTSIISLQFKGWKKLTWKFLILLKCASLIWHQVDAAYEKRQKIKTMKNGSSRKRNREGGSMVGSGVLEGVAPPAFTEEGL